MPVSKLQVTGMFRIEEQRMYFIKATDAAGSLPAAYYLGLKRSHP